MSQRRPLLALALGLSTATAVTSPALAQERLELGTFGEALLHGIVLPQDDPKVRWDLEGTLGLEADAARGAAPSPAWPFAFTEEVGFGLRHGAADFLELHVHTIVPLPIAPIGAAGKYSTWDLEFADSLHAQLALGGLDRDGKLEGHRGGADLSVDGALNEAGKYSTSFVRQDVGPFPFVEGLGRFTIAPRLNLNSDAGLVLPIAAEVHSMDVDRPGDEFTYLGKRFSSGIGIKPYDHEIVSGLVELVGVGWETGSFTPGKGAPPPRLAGVERFDLRVLHLDALTFTSNAVMGEISSGIGADWLNDPAGKASLATFATNFSAGLRGSPDDDFERSSVGAGFGFVYDGTYLADGSSLTRRARFEGFLEGFAMDRRTGGSIRAVAERMIDLPAPAPYRGAVAAEWYFAPVKLLQVGLDFTSTQECVSSATAAGPAWCHRFGTFARLAVYGTRRPAPKEPAPEVPAVTPPQEGPVQQAPVQQGPVQQVAQ